MKSGLYTRAGVYAIHRPVHAQHTRLALVRPARGDARPPEN